MKKLTLTTNEADFLDVLIPMLYAESGFSDVDILDIVKESDYSLPEATGTLSSLIGKGVLSTDEHIVDNYRGNLIYLEREEMHPEWAKEQGIEHEPPRSFTESHQNPKERDGELIWEDGNDEFHVELFQRDPNRHVKLIDGYPYMVRLTLHHEGGLEVCRKFVTYHDAEDWASACKLAFDETGAKL